MDDAALVAAIFAGIKELIELYEAKQAGKVSADDALKAITTFTDKIAENRKAAQDALDAKFPASKP